MNRLNGTHFRRPARRPEDATGHAAHPPPPDVWWWLRDGFWPGAAAALVIAAAVVGFLIGVAVLGR